MLYPNTRVFQQAQGGFVDAFEVNLTQRLHGSISSSLFFKATAKGP